MYIRRVQVLSSRALAIVSPRYFGGPSGSLITSFALKPPLHCKNQGRAGRGRTQATVFRVYGSQSRSTSLRRYQVHRRDFKSMDQLAGATASSTILRLQSLCRVHNAFSRPRATESAPALCLHICSLVSLHPASIASCSRTGSLHSSSSRFSKGSSPWSTVIPSPRHAITDSLFPCYARHELWKRGILRMSMGQALRSLSGNDNAFMRWTVSGYHKKIYTEYGLELVGWPSDLPFVDLSKPELTGLECISTLLGLWQRQELKFVPVALDKAARAARDPMDVVPGKKNRAITLPTRGLGRRSDIKKQRARKKADTVRFPPRRARNGPKSDRVVTAEAEAWAERAVCWGEDPSDPIEYFTDEEPTM